VNVGPLGNDGVNVSTGATDHRYFKGGAYRDVSADKLDYEGFLSPAVLKRYAEYMHKNRKQSDGRMRDSDNWQAGIPKDVYMKSMWRHFMDVWSMHRNTKRYDDGVPGETIEWEPGELEEALCALAFNVLGYLFEELEDR
jgi:hypothetical protein